LDWRRKYDYGVSREEIDAFVAGNACVKQFLGKYAQTTQFTFSRYLCMFFKWIKLWKDLTLGPGEFLQLLSEKRGSTRVEDRCWGRNLLLEFTRDNPDFKGKSHSLLYGAMWKSVNLFCRASEVELTSAKGAYGVKKSRKYRPEPYSVDLAKKVLAVLNQRDRAICMLGLQTGQSITQVLKDINGQYEYVERMIRQGKKRIRFDFDGRKCNNFRYYTFCSVDAITEIQKWMPVRARWLQGRKSSYLFIKRDGSQLTPEAWRSPFRELLQRHGVYKGPYTAVFHMFRKIFESEGSPPDRGISKDYIRFMMGHSVDDVDNDQLDIPGGVYDQSPFTHSGAVEAEYQKLEPYINIYSSTHSGGKPGEEQTLSQDEWADLKSMLDLMKQGKLNLNATVR